MLHQHSESCRLTPLHVFIHPRLSLGSFPALDLLIRLWWFPFNALVKWCEHTTLNSQTAVRHSDSRGDNHKTTTDLLCLVIIVILQSGILVLADSSCFYSCGLSLWWSSHLLYWVSSRSRLVLSTCISHSYVLSCVSTLATKIASPFSPRCTYKWPETIISAVLHSLQRS